MLLEGFGDAISASPREPCSGATWGPSQAITRAVGIVDEGLRGTLDLKAVGKLGGDLIALYRYVRCD